MKVNKFETKQFVFFGGNQVQIIAWTYNTDTDVIRYHVENKQNGFRAWVLEDKLTAKAPNR